MRWRTIDLNNHEEVGDRDRILAHIDSWWREFAAKTGELNDLFSRKSHWDLPGWMHRHLNAIHPALMWEYGPAANGPGHRLVITPESNQQLRPLVQTLLERAPPLDHWEFYAYRLPEDVKMALRSATARTGIDASEFTVNVVRGENNRIDVTFSLPAGAGIEQKTARHAAFAVSESLLGEECLDKWIGVIDAGTAERSSALKSLFGKKEARRYLELGRLRDTTVSLLGSIRDQLPDSPHFAWVSNAEWTIWKLQPNPAADYTDQQDMMIAKSANSAQWMATRNGGVFASERFSRCGEKFCYLKIDGSQQLNPNGFKDKAEIEDAVDEVLKPAQLGCHIGGGTGLRYSYIDLALRDIDAAIPILRDRLQAGKLPRRSWLLFYDADLSAEWVGIYGDSPSPPMAERS